MGTFLMPGCWRVRIPLPRLGVPIFWPGPTSVLAGWFDGADTEAGGIAVEGGAAEGEGTEAGVSGN